MALPKWGHQIDATKPGLGGKMREDARIYPDERLDLQKRTLLLAARERQADGGFNLAPPAPIGGGQYLRSFKTKPSPDAEGSRRSNTDRSRKVLKTEARGQNNRTPTLGG